MLSTIEQFPRGAGLQAVRTPRSTMENVRLSSLPQPQTGNAEQAIVGQSSGKVKLAIPSDSTVSSFGRSNSSSNSSDEGSGADCVSSGDSALATVADSDEEPEAIEAVAVADELTKHNEGVELARRSQRRVSDWKRSEQERREEEERARQERLEQEKRRKNHAAYLKQRRRAEIYALNALLRTLQQEKVATYIAAQKQTAQVRGKPNCSVDATSMKASAAGQLKVIGV